MRENIDPAASPEFISLQSAVAGRYSLDGELGRGGMGIVYLARDVSLDRHVAIKLLPPELSAQADVRAQFLAEARTAAKLSHPNIVPIHAVEDMGDLVFFVMAYIRGETLGERITRGGPLPVQAAVRLLREIAWALSYAHSQGVIHQDIKPDNILLEHETDRGLVTDFGIARIMSADDNRRPEEIVGTPEFMSPEQACGEHVDGRSDLYSLGVVGFLAAAGRLPFDPGTPAETVAHHIRTPPPRLTSVAPGVPRKLSGIVDRCLAKDADERVQTGAELAEQLSAALEAKKEIPVPVRVFIRDGHQGRGTLVVLLLLYLLFPFLGAIWWISGQGLLGTAAITTTIALIVATPFLIVARRARRIVTAGLQREDLIQALETENARRREELAFVYGEDHAAKARSMIRWSRRLLLGSLACFGIAAVASSGAWFVAGSVVLLAGAIAGGRGSERSDRRGRRRLKFWRSRFGRWLFKLASLGRPVVQGTQTFSNRPTEFAIGMAVAGLFESLPKETRRELGNLPEVVQGLEEDAQRMRARVEELSEVLGHASTAAAHDDPDSPLHAKRHKAVDDIRNARDQAQHRLTEAVAALENLRVDLLRMRAGTVNLESVTASLGAARELAAEVDRLLAGHEEIERSLRHQPTQ